MATGLPYMKSSTQGCIRGICLSFFPSKKIPLLSPALNLASSPIVNLILGVGGNHLFRTAVSLLAFQSNLGVHQVIHFSSAVDGVPICGITCCSLWLEWKRADCLALHGLFLPSFRGKLPTQTRVIYFYFCREKMAVFPEVTGHVYWKS